MVNRSLRSNLYTLALVNTLRITTPGVVESNKAVIVDTNKDLSGIRNLSVQNLNVNGTLLTASAAELNFVDTIPGIAEESRALVLDGNRDITNINALSASFLTGTLQTASQPNITSLGTLSNLNIQGSLNIIGHNGINTGLRLNNILITANASELNKLDGLTSSTAELNVLTGITSNVNQLNYTNTTKGTAEAEKALIFDLNRDITNIRNLTATNLTGTLLTANQPNITSVGTLNNLTINGDVNIATHNGLTSGLQLNGTLIMATATEINYLKNINPGTVIGNKVLAVDNNKDLLGFRNISLSGNLSTAQITLNEILIQSSADEINYLYNVTKGTGSNNKAVILDNNKDFSGIRNLTIDNLILSGSNLQLPSGNTAARPISPSLGFIRYNTETSQFEGYGAGNSWGSLGGVTNVQQTTKILAENSPGSNDNNLRFINNNSETMRITSTGNVGINNNNPNYKLDISGTLNCTSTSNFRDTMTIYKLGSNNNSVISGLILKNSYSSASSSGLGIGIDFWMPDSSGGQSYSGSLNCVVTNPVTSNFANKFEFKLYNAGIINTAASIDSTGLLTITSLSTSTITASNNINISNHNGTNIGLQLNGTLVTASAIELNYNDITTIGIAEASKALILNSSRNITNINNISINNLALNNTVNYRTLIDCGSIANDRILGLYNNITTFYGIGANDGLLKIQGGHSNGIAFYTSASNTSTGTEQMRISSSTTNILNTLALNGTSITASATEINYNDITTIGTAEASKALILDSNRDITNIRNLTANNLTGTLQTASQPNITSLGTLTNLSTGNITLNGILITSTATELNYNDITTVGSAEANKALIVDSNKDIININSLTTTNLIATNLTGSILTANQPNITSLGTLTSLSTGNITLNGTLITATASELNVLDGIISNTSELNYLSGITPGTSLANKALIIDSDKDISGIRNLTATNLTGTILTASQPNITSLGTLTSLSTGNITLNGILITATATELNYNDITTIGIAQASKALIVDSNKDIQSLRRLHLSNISIGTLDYTNLDRLISAIDNTLTNGNAKYLCLGKSYSTYNEAEWGYFHVSDGSTSNRQEFGFYGANGIFTITAGRKVGINKTNPSYDLDVSGDINLTGSLRFSGTSLTASVTKLNYNDITTTGTAEASKALILDASRNISNINSLTATNLIGTILTASQPNITSVGTLTSLSTNSLTLNGTAITATATELNYNDITTIGTAEASKALIIDANKDITSIRNLTATNLTGTILTASQPNITSVGTLTSLLTGNITLNGTLITASAAEINYNDITLIGTAEASKALILDASRNISNINSLTATNLTGTILTASQPNITSVGTLTSLSTNSLTLNGTAITATASDINKLATITATSTELNYNDITTIGYAEASKALIVDANKDITSIRNLTATNLTGTILTASQPNITSVGTLTSLSTGNITLNGTLITASATEINTLTSVNAGIVSANKALIVDSNKDLTGLRNLTISGELNIAGNTTIINSTQVNIKDNILQLNSGPTGSYDSGLIIQRYQTSNDTNTGDIINETNKENYNASSVTINTIVLPSNANINDNYYNGWWIKINSATTGTNQVRQVLSYNGTNKTITLSNNFTTLPTGTISVNLYNKSFSNLIWQESNKRFITGFTAQDISSGTLTILDYADLATNNLNILSTTDSINSTTGGSLTIAGGAAIAKKLFIGSDLSVTGNSTMTGTLTVNNNVSFGNSSNSSSIISLNSANSAMRIYTHSDGICYIQAGISTTSGSAADLFIGNYNRQVNDSARKFIIKADGKVGINTINPGYQLDVNGSINSTSLYLNGTLITSTAAKLNYNDITTTGIAEANKSLILDSSRNISNINSLSCTSLIVNGSAISASATELNYLSGITVGTASANKAIVLDSNKDINSINSLSANLITGTLQTSSQPNITSVGTLTSLSTGNITLNGTLITATATELNVLDGITATTTELNYLDITTVGTGQANKALILDSNRDITNINSLTNNSLITNGTANINNITIGGNRTLATWGLVGPQFNATSNIYTDSSTAANGTNNAVMAINSFQKSTLAASNSNVTYQQTIANVYIANGPDAGTNATINSRCALLTGGAIGINPGTINISNWSSALIHINSGINTTVVNDTGSTNIAGIIGTNKFNAVQYSSNTAGRTMTRAATMYIINSPSAGTNMTITNSHALYIGAGNTTLADSTVSTNTTSGALVVTGGVGIGGSVNIGGTLSVTGNITGTIATASQPNITSVGTLTSLSTNSLTLNGIAITATASDINKLATITASAAELNYNDITTIGTAEASKALIVDANKDITSIRNLTATNLTGTLLTASQPNITSVGTLTSLSTNSLTLNGTAITATASDINKLVTVTATATELNYNDITTIGTAEASKALIVDANKDITSIRNLTATNLTGTLLTASQPNITSVGTLTSLSTNSLTLNGTAITATASDINKLATVTASAAELNYNDITTIGTAQASKALIVDSNRNISNINSLSCTSLTVNGSAIAASGTELNYLSGVTPGTGQASKAIILDSSNNINSGINNFTISGTLTVGTSNTTNTVGYNNRINFKGTYGDATENMTVIAERQYASIEASELYFFKGNDPDTGSGMDRIRFRSSEFRFQTYTTAEDYSALNDNNNRFFISNVGKIGINNINPQGTLDFGQNASDSIINLYTHSTTNETFKIGANNSLLKYQSGSSSGHAWYTGSSTTSAGTELLRLTSTGNLGINNNNPSYRLDVTGDINLTGSLRFAGTAITATASDINKLATVTATDTELNYNDITTIGSAEASKALIVDSNRDIINIRNLTATNLTGTILTASQPNITSVGILTSLSTNSLTLNGTLITATASDINKLATVTATDTELNYNDITTIGTAEASKAVILNSSRNISNINNISVNNIGLGNSTDYRSLIDCGNVNSGLGLDRIIGVINNGTIFSGFGAKDNLLKIQSGGSNGIAFYTGSTNSSVGTEQVRINSSTTNIINTLALNGTSITSTAAELNKLAGTTAITSDFNKLASVTATATELNYNDITAIGTAEASKAIILDSAKSIKGITKLQIGTNNATLPNADFAILNSSANARFRVGSNESSGDCLTFQWTYVGANNSNNRFGIDFFGVANQFCMLNSGNVGISTGTPGYRLDVNGSFNCTSFNINGTSVTSTATELNYNDITTIGTAEASKALILDTSRNIININSLTATNLTGTILTASQPNITSVGTLTSLSTGNITLNGTLITAAASDINTLASVTAGTVSASKALIVDSNKDLTGLRNLTISGDLTVSGTTTTINSTQINIKDNILQLNSAPAGTYDSGLIIQRYQTNNDTNIGDIVNETSKENYNASSVTINTIVLPSNANSNNNYYNGWWIKIQSATTGANQVRQVLSYNGTNKTITLSSNFTTLPTGTISVNLYNKSFSNFIWQESNKRFITSYTAQDISSGILTVIDYADLATNNLSILSTTDATSSIAGGSLTIAGGAAIAKKLYIGSDLSVTGNSTLTGTLSVTGNITGTLNTASQPNITSVGTLTSLSTGNITLNGALITASAAELNYNDITTIGTAEASKALVLDSNRDITNIRNLTATNLTGTLNTASQPNITSVGTLTSLSTGNITLNGTLITASAAELNYNDITTIGTAEASKALIVDSNKDITSIRNLTATNLTGTLNTASQPNITSVGTLTSLSTGNITLNGTLITASATELNYNDITTIGTAQASKALIVDSNKDIQSIRRLHLSNISIGTLDYTLTTRLISAIDNTITNGSNRYLCLGKNYSNNNEAEWGYFHNSDGSTSNRQEFGFAGANGIFAITAGRKVGINNTSPSYDLDITGDLNLTNTLKIGTNTIVDSSRNISNINTFSSSGLISNIIANNTATNVNYQTWTNDLTTDIISALQMNNVGMDFGTTSNHPIGLITNNTERLTITNAGIVNITNNTASTNSTTGALTVAGGIGSNGNISAGQIIRSGINNSSYATIGTSGAYFQTGNATITNSGAALNSTIATAVFNSFARPTLAASNTGVTTTNAATIYIENEPLNGTNMTLSNSYSLWVNSGKVLLGSGFGDTNKSIATLTINADTLNTNAEGAAHGLLISGGNTIANACLYMGADNTNSVGYIQSSKIGLHLPVALNPRGGNVGVGLINPGYKLDISGDLNVSGNYRSAGSIVSFSAISGVTSGTALASKALILDSSSNISGINNLSSTSICLGTQTSNLSTRFISALDSAQSTGTLKYISFGQSNTDRNAVDFGFLYNGVSDNTNAFSIGFTTVGRRLVIQAGGNVGIGNTSPGYRLDVTGDINLSGSLRFGGTALTSTVAELNYLDLTTGPGTAEANKALVLDTSSNISGINNLTISTSFIISNANASFRILPHSDNIVYLQAGLNTNTDSAADIFIGNYQVATNASTRKIMIKSDGKVGIGLINPSYALDISGDLNISGNYRSAGSIVSFSAISGVTAGTVSANKALIADGLKTISDLSRIVFNTGSSTRQVSSPIDYRCLDTNIITFNNAVTAASGTDTNHQVSNFIGRHTITASNTNVTTTNFSTFYIQGEPVNGTNMTITNKYALYINSGNSYFAGNLNIAGHNGSTTGLQLGGTLITATASELNILDGVTATTAELNFLDITTIGTAQASKAMILDSNKDIISIRRISATNISLNNATTYPTVLHCGSTTADRIIGVFNNTTSFYGFGVADNLLKIQGGHANGIAFYTNSTGSALGAQQMTITSTSTSILQTTSSTSSTTGALIVSGGIGCAESVNIAGSLTVNNISTIYGTLNLTSTANNTTTYGIYQTWSNPATTAIECDMYINNSNVQFGTSTNHSLKLMTNNTERMIITNAGNVGIGLTNPSYKLEISGNMYSSGAIVTADYISATNYLATYSYIWSGWNTTTNANFVGNWPSSGYWGIGYDSTLGASNNTIRLGTCSSTGSWSGYANVRCNSVYAQGSISLSVGGYAYFTSAQNIGGAGAQTNSYSFYGNGRIACNGEINVISDYRNKNNIEILDNQYCQDFIKKTIPVKFNYNNDQDQKHFGYIAQDVYKAGFTDLVALCPQDGLAEIIEEDGFINPKDVSFAMSTNELIPILAKNIKIIYDEKEILEQKIENQQNIIENLENENQQLKDQIQTQNNLINDILLRLQNLENNN